MAASKLISSFGSRGDATKVFCRPASIIIDKYAHSSKHMNKDTMATAKSRDGHILEVSLTIHQPPALSYFCVDCHRPPNYKPDAAYLGESLHMVAAEGCFLLLRGFFSSSGEEEYFMYKAGNGDSGTLASLERLPLPRAYCLPNLREFGIVPRHDGHYLLAGLAMGFVERTFYRLHLYSSEDKKWEDIKLKNPCPQIGRVITNKVVTLGEGILGWVDFLHGMLVCNMLETDLTARYIPLPDLLPENKDTLEELHPGPFATRFRDLTCINGLVQLIEMEHYFQNPAFQVANGKVLDSDLIMSRTCKEVTPSPSWMGWKAVMWSRTLSSDGWEMGLVLDAADIVFDNSKDLSLLSGLKGFSDTDKIVFKDLYSAYPTLSADGDDILYLKTWKNLNDLDGRLVALDLRSKSVKAVVDYTLAKHSPLVKAFGLCTVPSVTTGNASARDLNNTSICVGHPSSCESNRKRPRQVGDYTLAKHSPLVKAFRLCTVPPVTTGNASARDPNNTSICVGHPSSCESNSKRPRLLAEKVNHGDQNIVQNDHISLVPLVENKLPPLQRFIKHYTPFYSHQNNQASQPCFNYFGGTSYHGYSQQLPAPTTFVEGQSSEKCDGSRDIGYAPPCPPQLPDYSKYHPLWQHSQPMTYSSVIGPYKVSQPCFSYCEGASHDGHSRQIPAPTSFAEGQYPDRWAGSGGLGPWLSAPTCPQPQFPEYSNNYQPLRQHSQPSEERVIHSSTFGPWEAPQCV